MTGPELDRFFATLDAWASAHAVPVETVAYGTHGDQVVDLRRGAAADGRSLVLVLHGGFWRAPYTRRNTTALAVALAHAGWASVNVEYRREGPGAYRVMLDDVAAARRRFESFGRAVAIGHSAGGHLALWLAAEQLVDGAVALGGVCDLRAAADTGLGMGAVVELLGGAPDEVPDAYAAADPAGRLPLGRPQVLVHGTADDRVPLEHARQYAERACRAGDDCRVVEVDADHFAPIDPRSTVWPDVLRALESVLPFPSAPEAA